MWSTSNCLYLARNLSHVDLHPKSDLDTLAYHRRWSSQLWTGQGILPENIMYEINKTTAFYVIFARKMQPEFYVIKLIIVRTIFPDFFLGGGGTCPYDFYHYVAYHTNKML